MIGEKAEWFEPEAHQPLAENAAVLLSEAKSVSVKPLRIFKNKMFFYDRRDGRVV